ncbi:coil containing protein [Vibrio phage 1.052.A._10N.286.46.C3]|nr:coil containing protein [Vibrio phage 1.052.A._10N.286.46.C3]
MSKELIVIEESTALQVLSTKDGVEKLIDDVRSRVMSLEGGNLKTGVGRAAIKSNAFKATKAKKMINDNHIQPLIDDITKKIQPDLDTIKALKDSKKVLDAGLDQIRKDVNEEVAAIEEEIKRVAKEKADAIEAEKVAKEIATAHEMALLMNENFNREQAERLAKEQAEREEAERVEKERREAYEKKLADEAAAKAKAEAEAKALAEKQELERIAQESAQREKEAKERAEKAERDRVEAEERARIEAEQAEQRRIQWEKDEEARRLQAEAKAKRDAEEAAQRARDEEKARQEAERKRIADEAAGREADVAHRAGINRAAMADLINECGLEDEQAKAVVKAIAKRLIPNITINY